jgi:hypothetical protein
MRKWSENKFTKTLFSYLTNLISTNYKFEEAIFDTYIEYVKNYFAKNMEPSLAWKLIQAFPKN